MGVLITGKNASMSQNELRTLREPNAIIVTPYVWTVFSNYKNWDVADAVKSWYL